MEGNCYLLIVFWGAYERKDEMKISPKSQFLNLMGNINRYTPFENPSFGLLETLLVSVKYGWIALLVKKKVEKESGGEYRVKFSINRAPLLKL